MQLTAEGGWDAAQEAPFLYAAIDALAARAGTWAERQQRLRIESASKQAASEMAEPVVISRQAIAFVKQVKAVSQIAVFVSKPVLCFCPCSSSSSSFAFDLSLCLPVISLLLLFFVLCLSSISLPSCYIPALPLPRPLPLIYLSAFLLYPCSSPSVYNTLKLLCGVKSSDTCTVCKCTASACQLSCFALSSSCFGSFCATRLIQNPRHGGQTCVERRTGNGAAEAFRYGLCNYRQDAKLSVAN